MDRDCFSKLCDRIEKVVGEEHFMSEEFLHALETSQVHKRCKCMQLSHKDSTGGFVCGEIRLAITLRLMAGASYLDLGLLYVCGYSSIYRIFHHAIEHWMCNDKIACINCFDNLNDIDAMNVQKVLLEAVETQEF